MQRGILFGLGFVVVLAAAAVFLLVPRGVLRVRTPPGAVATRAPQSAAPSQTPANPPKTNPSKTPAPSFDIVTVAPDGSAVIAGRAAPGSRVTVFDGHQKLGEVTANRRGEWALVPDHPLPAGKGRLSLRVATGQGPPVTSAETVAVAVPRTAQHPSSAPVILARAETPPAGSRYTVQRGNSLWQIARHVFGAGIRYLGIYSANSAQIRNPNLIYPGQVFKLPKS